MSVVVISLSKKRQSQTEAQRELRHPYFKMYSALHSLQELQHNSYVLSPSARVHVRADQTWPNRNFLAGCQAGMWVCGSGGLS